MDILFDGITLDPCGFGVVNRNLLLQLKENDIKIKTKYSLKHKNKHLIPKSHLLKLEPLQHTNISNNAPLIASYPIGFSFIQQSIKNLEETRYVIFFTMTEVGELNSKIQEEIKYADEIWVPTEFDLIKFKKYHDKVFKMNLFVDESIYNRDVVAEPTIKNNCKDFVFLFCGSGIYRKGLLETCEAYLKTFKQEDNVTLLILSKEISIGEIHDRLGLSDRKDLAHIYVIDKYIHENDIPPVYACADVLVLPSKGEGWSLPAIEFAYMGKPSIMTNFGGHTEFLDENGSWLIKVDSFSKDPVMYSLYKTEQYNGVEFPSFNVAFLNNLADCMKEAYQNKNIVKQKGDYIYEKTRSLFNKENAVRSISNRLVEIDSELKSGAAPKNIFVKRDKSRDARKTKFQNFKFALETKNHFRKKENVVEHFKVHFNDICKFVILDNNDISLKFLPWVLTKHPQIYCDTGIFNFDSNIMDSELATQNIFFYYDAWLRFQLENKAKIILGGAIKPGELSDENLETLINIVDGVILDKNDKMIHNIHNKNTRILALDFSVLDAGDVVNIKDFLNAGDIE